MSQTTTRTSRPTLGAIRRPRRGLAALRGDPGVPSRDPARGRRSSCSRSSSSARSPSPAEPRAAPSRRARRSARSAGSRRSGRSSPRGATSRHVHVSNLILGLAALLVAFFARGAFCGWLCPLGFLQDLVAGFSHLIQRRIPPVRLAIRTLERRASRLAALDRPLRLLKYVVLAWAVLGAAAYGTMVFRGVDPWNALLEIGSATAGLGLVVLVLVLVTSFFVERAWCRYACPLGAATGLVSRFSPIRLERVGGRVFLVRRLHDRVPDGSPGRDRDRHHQPGLHRLPRVRRGVPAVRGPRAPGRPAGPPDHHLPSPAVGGRRVRQRRAADQEVTDHAREARSPSASSPSPSSPGRIGIAMAVGAWQTTGRTAAGAGGGGGAVRPWERGRGRHRERQRAVGPGTIKGWMAIGDVADGRRRGPAGDPRGLRAAGRHAPGHRPEGPRE